MTRYLIGRAVQAVITILLVLVLTFFLARLAGDPTALLLPATADQQDVNNYRHALGLDASIPVQLLRFLSSAARLNFGTSVRSGQPAFSYVLDRLPATLELALVSFVVTLVLALGLALIIELTPNRTVRSGLLGLALLRESIPIFVFGLLMIYIFGVRLNVLPFVGESGVASFVLPVATLSSAALALYLRILRSSFAEQWAKDYARTAIAKGCSRSRLVLRELFPNVLLPLITIAALNLGLLIVGAVIVETVFSWPGVAHAIVDAVTQRDYPVIQAGVVLIATVFVLVNLAADILYAKIDPRVRL